MSLMAVTVTLLFGGLVGVVSGLVGVGGGIVMVPLLYLLFAHPEWSGIVVPPAHHAVVAHATSLFVIVPTALAGIVAYQRSRLVAWRVALPMVGTALLAAMVGVQVAVRLPPEVLKASFGAFLMASGLNLLKASRRAGEAGAALGGGVILAVLGGLLIGFITSLLGVGGGIVAIPILIYLVRLDMKKVAATSLGIVVFSALMGAVTYMITGWGHAELPPALRVTSSSGGTGPRARGRSHGSPWGLHQQETQRPGAEGGVRRGLPAGGAAAVRAKPGGRVGVEPVLSPSPFSPFRRPHPGGIFMTRRPAVDRTCTDAAARPGQGVRACAEAG
jgi:uncharacterized protein